MMTRRAPFRVFDGSIETGFEQRLQGLLRLAWHQRSWHVIVADPGSGKSMGIRDLVLSTTHGRSMMSGRTSPVLAVTAPKNDPKEAALGTALLRALGFSMRGRWSEHKYTLLSALPLYKVECLIIDDAHDLSMQHLILLKELTDQLRIPPYDRRLGLCLVTAERGTAVPLKVSWINQRRCGSNSGAGSTGFNRIAVLLGIPRTRYETFSRPWRRRISKCFPRSTSKVDRNDLFLVDPPLD